MYRYKVDMEASNWIKLSLFVIIDKSELMAIYLTLTYLAFSLSQKAIFNTFLPFTFTYLPEKTPNDPWKGFRSSTFIMSLSNVS